MGRVLLWTASEHSLGLGTDCMAPLNQSSGSTGSSPWPELGGWRDMVPVLSTPHLRSLLAQVVLLPGLRDVALHLLRLLLRRCDCLRVQVGAKLRE